MRPKVHARKTYLVNKQLQLSYSLILILCVGLIVLIFGLSLWYINKIHLDLIHRLIGENALPTSYINAVQNQLLIGIPIAILIISGLLLILGIFATHRIAGPMYRITKNLNLIGVENQMDTIQIRKQDHLKEMADAFNHMVHTLKDRMYQDIRLIDHARGKISKLHDSLKGETIDIKKLVDQVKEIDKLATELKDRKQV